MIIQTEQKTVTRDTLSKAVKRECGITLKLSSALVDKTLESIAQLLCKGQSVTIRGFGSFYLRYKNERTGRNPKTMEKAVIHARWVIKFKPSSVLKKKIADTRKYLS